MPTTISTLANYFKYLCEQHPDLEHNEAAGQRVFEVSAYEEAFSDFRTAGAEKGFFVRFVLPTLRMSSNGPNAWKTYQAGLMVGKYYSVREDAKAAKLTAWSEAERVADEFIARMVADSRNGYALFNGSFDSVDRINLSADFTDAAGDGSYAAVLYIFDLATFRCITHGGAGYGAWNDGGLTV